MTPPRMSLPLPTDLGAGPRAVSASAVAKRFGGVSALDGADLQVPEGSVYVLVGPNGAGKSTLLRILVGLLSRDEGSLDVLGYDPAESGAEVRARVGYVPEGQDLGYSWMRVDRLLTQQRVYYSTWDDIYAQRLVKALDVDVSRRCRQLSKGERRRVQLILAMAHRPALLLLDEPTDGLDHVVRDSTMALLSEHLADHPTTVLMSTHRVYEVERLVDTVGVLSEGRLLGQIPRSTLGDRLLRYWTDVPPDWDESRPVDAHVIRRVRGRREVEWLAWGDRSQVTESLSRAGAEVRDITSVSIDDAATALLSHRETS